MAGRKRLVLLAALLILLPALALLPGRTAASPATLGFNWDNGPKVYVLHWNQKSVSASDPALAFRLAHANGVTLMRMFIGTSDIVQRWKSDPTGTLVDLRRMVDDADANGVQVILSSYMTQATIEALAGQTYVDWTSAQRALVTLGSPAWNGYVGWLRAVIPALTASPAVYSWEATNEPSWMLGSDAGHINLDQAANWLNAFQGTMKALGAVRINMGGSTFASMSDAQLKLTTQYTDLLDDHWYPDCCGTGTTVVNDASTLVARFQTHIDRVEALQGRSYGAMVGEFGTLPWDWFTSVAQAAVARGWTALAWEFDGWDVYWFNATYRPEVLAYIKTKDVAPAPAPFIPTLAASVVAGPYPLAVDFGANASGGNPPYTYAWDFGDGTGARGSGVNHAFQTQGNFTVRLTATDSRGANTSVLQTITVVPPLRASAQAEPTSGTPPLTVNLTGQATGGLPPYRYRWTFPDGSTSDLPRVAHTLPAAGRYLLNLTVRDGGGVSSVPEATSVAVLITVTPPLAVVVGSSPSAGPAPLVVLFNATATGGDAPYAFAWDLGDGNRTTGPGPSHTYRSGGSHHVVLTVTDAMGRVANASVTINVDVPVGPPPIPLVVTATAEPLPGLPLQVQFHVQAQGGAAPYAYAWDFGDGGASTDANPRHAYATPGLYTVTVDAWDDSGHRVRSLQEVQVPPPPSPSTFATFPVEWGLVAFGGAVGGAVLVLARRRRRVA